MVPPVPSHLPSPGQVPFNTDGSVAVVVVVAAVVIVAAVAAGEVVGEAVAVTCGFELELSLFESGGSDILREALEGDERERLEGRAMRRDLR